MRTIIPVFIILLFASCQSKPEQTQTIAKYTCSMHPQIIQDKPGKCPICAMDLVKMTKPTANDNAIMLNETQIKLANIATTLTRHEPIGETSLVTGRLTIDENQTEIISSRIQGRMERLYIRDVGQEVIKGQKLYDVYSEQLLTLQQEYLLSIRQSEELKGDRYKSLVASSEKKLLLYGMTKDQVQQLAATRQTHSVISFVSPVSGTVARIDATEGQYVNEGSALYRIERLDNLWVEAELYPGENQWVRMGDKVKVQVSGFENDAVEGTVTFSNPEFRPGTQITSLRLTIKNQHKLFKPGMQATVLLNHKQKQALALPIDAVVRDGKGAHVWILGTDGAFRPRVVKTGIENSEKIEIAEGIAEKENVVISGAYLLYGELVLKRGGDPMTAQQHNHE